MEFREPSTFGGLDKTEVGFGLFDFQRKFKNLPDCLKINFRNHSIIGSFTPQKSTLEKLQGTWLTFFFLFLDISFICHHFVNYYIKLRIFVTAEPGDNSVEMKRVLQDYLRSMRISSEVCCRLKPNGLPKPNPFLPNCFRLKLLRSKLKKLNHSWPIIRQAICSRTSSLIWKYFRPVYRIETFRAELMVKALYHGPWYMSCV